MRNLWIVLVAAIFTFDVWIAMKLNDRTKQPEGACDNRECFSV